MFFGLNVLLTFSSPEHKVLMVSYCDQSVSVIRHALGFKDIAKVRPKVSDTLTNDFIAPT